MAGAALAAFADQYEERLDLYDFDLLCSALALDF
jgi:hypothetical protein